MPQKSSMKMSWLQSTATRITKLHFVFIACYMASIIILDSWNVISHQAVAQRWTLAGSLLVINTILWYLSRIRFNTDTIYIFIILILVVCDIIFAGLNVFWQRGLASKAVFLFALPLVTAACMRSKSTLFAAASLCAATYSMATIQYFNQHYGESYKVELYGEVGLYSALFFVIAAMLWVIISPKNNN
jgi:hypothetical protein